MQSMYLVLLLLGVFKCAHCQFGFGGGFGGFGGFGCGSNPPTIANQCYQPKQDSTVFCTAQGSSVYRHAPYYGDYSAYLAVDGQLSPGNSGFYHSSLEPYPALKIKFVDADQITAIAGKEIKRVEIYQRCDANELYHRTSFEIRGDLEDPPEVYTSPRLVGGKICATTTQGFTTGGTKFTVPCPVPVADAKAVWIQKTTLHSHGQGWPNFNGNRWNSFSGNAPAQNTNAPVCFLMINEVVLY